jgi:hypothetical protein
LPDEGIDWVAGGDIVPLFIGVVPVRGVVVLEQGLPVFGRPDVLPVVVVVVVFVDDVFVVWPVPVFAVAGFVAAFGQFIAGLPAGGLGLVVLVDGVVVVVVGGGFVLWAKAGAVRPAARLAADAKPRILAPRVMRLLLSSQAIQKCLG